MSEATTPIEAAFEVQRRTIQHGQQLFEQTLDVQQRGAETLLRNVLAVQRDAQQQGLDLTRQLVDAQADAFGSVVDADFQETVDQQLAEVSEIQDDAVDQFEAELLGALEDLSEQQRELFAQSVQAVLEAQDEVERGAVESVQQARAATESVQENAEDVAQDVQESPQEVAEEAADATGQQPVTSAEMAVEQLEGVDGLGSTYAERLREQGIESPTHLVEANVETIAEAADVREDQAEQWIESARTS